MSTTFTVPKYATEGKRFTGEITGGAYVWKARLDWKPAPARDAGLNPSRTVGREKGPAVITAGSEAALHAELRRLDSSVKFVKAQVSKSKLGTPTAGSSADTDLLEQMRVDPDVSDIVYNRACRQFEATPRPRPDFTVAPTVVTKSPYDSETTGELNHAFLQLFLKQHPELTEAGHGPYNTDVLVNWHRDSGLSVLTLASLERAFQECSALRFFRSSLSGTRTRGQNDSNVVRSYSFERIQEYRNPPQEEQPAQPPAPGSPEEMADRRRVMNLATQHVQNLHPLWKPSSGEFQRELLKTVKEFAVASNPKLGVGKVAHF